MGIRVIQKIACRKYRAPTADTIQTRVGVLNWATRVTHFRAINLKTPTSLRANSRNSDSLMFSNGANVKDMVITDLTRDRRGLQWACPPITYIHNSHAGRERHMKALLRSS